MSIPLSNSFHTLELKVPPTSGTYSRTRNGASVAQLWIGPVAGRAGISCTVTVLMVAGLFGSGVATWSCQRASGRQPGSTLPFESIQFRTRCGRRRRSP